jgi:Zn-dependent peptidase ImmA (M78 family)
MSNLSKEQWSVVEKHQNKLPINVVGIAHDFEIKVYKGKDKQAHSGKIFKDSDLGGKSGYAIFVNADHNFFRQRFTIAHELAHFLLHKEAIGDGIVEDALYRSGLSNGQEAEANKLAADILMPWRLIKAEMDKGRKTICELSEVFQVSEIAMSIRLGMPS